MFIQTLRHWFYRAAPIPQNHSPLFMRKALGYYLHGSGIEIGALHRPMDITGLNIQRIQYVDRASETDLYRMYPELQAYQLTKVDIIDDGEALTHIPNQSLDFVIANHFIEHTRNPIGTIENWAQKLRQGGIVFLTVPDKHRTFDKERTLTPLQHLIDDYHTPLAQRPEQDKLHFEEWARFVDKLPEAEINQRVEFLIALDYSIHFHTFTLHSFMPIIEYIIHSLQHPLRVIACANTLRDGDEFIVVLEKHAGHAR